MQNELSNWTRGIVGMILVSGTLMGASELKLPVVIAHRGASAVAPENTKSSIEEACRMGAAVIEFDVRQTSDGELVLFHDKDLERIAGIGDTLESRDWAYVRNLDVGKWFGGKYAGETPIRLREAIELCRQGNAVALIEHKTGDARLYAEAIRELKAEGDVIVQSFNWKFLSAFRVEMESVPTGALGSKKLSKEKIGQLESLKPDWVGWNFGDLSESNLKDLQSLDFRVALWTVNDPAEAEKWLRRGVDGIITDHPDKMLLLLEE